MSFENFKNESEGSNVEASIAALEKENRMDMSKLQDKFEKSDTEKRTKVAKEIVDLDNSYSREIEALREPKKVATENKVEEKKEVTENKELKENKKEINLEEISLFSKAEAGFLLDPKDIRDEIERLKQEIKDDNDTLLYNYESLQFGDDKKLNKGIIDKENQIKKLEIILLDTENKIKNDYGKKGPENVALIMSQEDKILKSLKELNEDDLSSVPQARELIHKWNVADAKDYFSDEQKIKGALLIALENKKKEEIAKPQVKEAVVEEKNIESQVIKETPAEKKKREDLEMFDDMQKIAYFKEPIKEVQNNQNEQVLDNKEVFENENKESVQEKVDKKKRAGIFEYIRKNKKLKWLLMALGITTVGVGVFKGMEKNDDKKQDKIETRVDKAENKPDSTIVLTPEDFESEADKILKGVNPDVSETITEEVGLIRKMVVLKKGDGVGLINDYKMHNSYKVNFIDGETGAIYKNLEAISRTVQPGDLVIENTNGEIFVVCFYGIHDSGKTGYEGLSNNSESNLGANNAVEQTVPQVNIETTPGDSVTKNNVEVKTNITPKDSSNNEFTSSNPEFDFANMPTISLDSLIKANKNAEIKTEIKDTVKEVKTEVTPVKEKKNFFQRLFGKKEKKSDFSKLIGDPKEDIKNNKDQSNLSFDTNKAVIEENIIDNAVDSVAKSNVAPDSVATAPQYVPRTGGTIETGDNNGRSGLQSMPRPSFNLEKDNSNHVSLQEELNESSTSLYPDKTVSTETPKMSEENKNKSQVSKNSAIFGPEKTSKSKEDFLKEEIKSKLKFKPIKNDSIRVETPVAPVTPEKNNSDIMIINKGEGRSIVKIDASLKEYFPKPDSVATIKKDKDGYIIYSDGSKGSTVKLGPEFAEYFSKPNVPVTIERKDDDYFLYSDGRNGSIVKIDKYFAKYFVNEDFTDKDTAVVASQMIDSLKTTGATEVKLEQNYVIEKTEKPAETVPGQIKTMLTLIKTEKGYLVKNSNGTNSDVYLAFDVVAQLPGFTGEDTMTYVKNPDNTWSKVVAVVGE